MNIISNQAYLVEEKAWGTPNVPSGRRKSPAKAVLVQANIRQVPAHVRWCQRSRGTNRSRKDFRRDIDPDGIINLITTLRTLSILMMMR